MKNQRKNSGKIIDQNGFALIEVMVTAVIVAVGLVGLIATQLKSIQFNHHAQLLSDASVAKASMLDHMRLHPIAVTAGDFNLNLASDVDFTPANDAEQKADQVLTSLSHSHPGATLEINCEGMAVNYCQMCIGWNSSQIKSATTPLLTTGTTVICSNRLVL